MPSPYTNTTYTVSLLHSITCTCTYNIDSVYSLTVSFYTVVIHNIQILSTRHRYTHGLFTCIT